MHLKSRQRGVSLIEVLMAVLIFSIGLIGLAGLLVISTRSNHAAYLRTQVTFLASNMADRMRANPMGVWSDAYNITALPAAGGADSCLSSACTPAALATRDIQKFSNQLAVYLPEGATATIACDNTKTGLVLTTAQTEMRPPYGGTCAMTLTWTEREQGDSTHQGGAAQTFAWEFQP